MIQDKFSILIELLHFIEQRDRDRARTLVKKLCTKDPRDPEQHEGITEIYIGCELAKESVIRMRALVALARDLQRGCDGCTDHFARWVPRFSVKTLVH